MTKGFLIVDPKMTTIIIPYDDEDLVEFFRYKPGYPRNLDKAKTHDTLKALDKDIRAYLKGEYEEGHNDSDF